MATQLTHLPKMISYGPGNLLSYIPLYENRVSTKELMGGQRVYESFFNEIQNRSFRNRSDSVALAQRDCLNDPSIYVVNHKSLLVNKMQVNYDDDCSPLLCTVLLTNTLKWSESFLGDTMLYDFHCKYEEPLRRIAMDMDAPKVLLFRIGKDEYSFSPPGNPIDGREIGLSDYAYLDDIIKGLLRGNALICKRGLCLDHLPPYITIPQSYSGAGMAHLWAMNIHGEGVIKWSDIIRKAWKESDNLTKTLNGELISLDGLFGSCFGFAINQE